MPALTTFWDTLQPLQAMPTRVRRESNEFAREDAAPARLLVEAQAQAEELLAKARAEAEILLDDARVQAEALREAAWQEGFHDGQTAGRSSIEMIVRDEWQTEKQALRAQIEEIMTQIGAARQSLWDRQEAEMVAFSLAIARQVVKTEVTQNPEVVRAVLQNALRRVTDKDNVRIRVSMGDAAVVKAMREEILAMTDGLRHLEIVDDRRVGDGGCVIETGAGTIDAKIETQIAEVERALEAQAGPLRAE